MRIIFWIWYIASHVLAIIGIFFILSGFSWSVDILLDAGRILTILSIPCILIGIMYLIVKGHRDREL